MRLSTVLTFGVLLAVSVRWLDQLKQSWLALPALILLFGNPYVLDFFGLARGYGMGMAFLCLAVFALFRYAAQPEQSRVWPVFLAGLLSVEANFTLLNFYLALVLVFLLLSWNAYRQQDIPSRKVWWQHLRPMLGFTALTLALVVRPLYKITQAHQLFGGATGFWHDTAESLLRQSLYGQTYAGAVFPTLNTVAMALALLFAGIALWCGYREGLAAFRRPFVLIFSILFLSALGIVVQHHWLHTEYLFERTGVFFLPMFALSGITALDMAARRAPVPAGLVATALALLLLLHGKNTCNTRYVLEWKYDSNTLDMLKHLEHISQTETALPKPLRLGVNPHYEPSSNFYRETLHFDWLQAIHQDGFGAGEKYDFGYLMPGDLENPDRRLNGQVLEQFEPSGGQLVR